MTSALERWLRRRPLRFRGIVDRLRDLPVPEARDVDVALPVRRVEILAVRPSLSSHDVVESPPALTLQAAIYRGPCPTCRTENELRAQGHFEPLSPPATVTCMRCGTLLRVDVPQPTMLPEIARGTNGAVAMGMIRVLREVADLVMRRELVQLEVSGRRRDGQLLERRFPR